MMKFPTLVAALVATIATPLRSQDSSRFRVTEMRALLFFQDSGGFSTFNAMAEGLQAPALWNTAIGEGAAAPHASAATLVLVRVQGPSSGAAGKPVLHVTASEQVDSGWAVAIDKSVPLDPFFPANGAAAWVPFIIYGTGCETVKVKATIISVQRRVRGKGWETRESTPYTKTIPFKCGE
jgi:hypothetical protein